MVVWWVWWYFPKNQTYRLGLILSDAKDRADVEDNFRKTIGQLLGGIAAVLIGAGFAYLQQQAASELLISNQVAKGFEQLGSEKVIVRLGGIYALEYVMNTSDKYHLQTLEALCAFIRNSTVSNKRDWPLATDIQAVLTVIGRRAAAGAGQIDLVGAVIPRADLKNADLSGANLSYTNLSGADLGDAHLSDANLDGANLEGANLDRADLSGANLSDANLIGANLDGAHLEGADLGDAHLSGANLSGAHLDLADLSGANLSGAHLDLADLSGVFGLSQTQLSSACGENARLPPDLNLEPCR